MHYSGLALDIFRIQIMDWVSIVAIAAAVVVFFGML